MPLSLQQHIRQTMQDAVDHLLVKNHVEQTIEVALSRPKTREHGDYACNVAMALAALLKQNPRAVAQAILAAATLPEEVEKTDIAGPGFINITLKAGGESDILKTILQQGASYGCLPTDEKNTLCLEFVSANPTGPMHVGHGRGAVVGDALANVLAARGYNIHKEYYINDAGAQIGVLANSVWLRMQELQGMDITFPDSAYPGQYIIDIATNILGQHSFAEWLAFDDEARATMIGELAVVENMAMIRADLAAIGIEFHQYFSEKTLHESGKVKQLVQKLEREGLIYRGSLPPPKGKEVKDYQAVEQLLFRTTDFGDDVDRPVEKQDGSPTYFAADIAYHDDKVGRGFSQMIDIWGADHGGYVTRVQSAMHALTGLKQQPEVILVQMVNLTRDGQPFKMSKRAGTFVTLNEVVEEVGKDAVRFNFMTRRVESQLDFDLEAAKQKNDENPVYYVQYAFARVSAILRKAAEEGISIDHVDDINTAILTSKEELKLLQMLLSYPEMLATAAERREPYRVALFAMHLAAAFHSFYHHNRVIGVEPSLMQARLLLLKACAQVIQNALGLLGVSAPEQM